MFKALLAASLAMLACCAAAAWAGPVEPPGSRDQTVDFPRELVTPGRSAASMVPEVGRAANSQSLLETVVIEGFVPVSLSATYDGAARPKSVEEAVAPLSAQGQPAVIPLPHPLYAAAVLLTLLVVARRLIIRTCRA